ncbi:MAG: LemA family protein [Candidatus Woesearchaeota archaeon]
MAKKEKTNYTLWIVLGVVVLFLMIFVGMYNSLVKVDTSVEEAWGNIETQYQRRADLIPNLVSTVKAYSDYEGEVLTEVTAARSAWAGAGTQAEQMAAANGMDSALARLMVVVENYPDLKANQNYLALQDELAGTENRISTARTRFNEVVKDYNRKVRMFPSNIIAGMFGFEQKESFEADEGAGTVPKVEF